MDLFSYENTREVYNMNYILKTHCTSSFIFAIKNLITFRCKLFNSGLYTFAPLKIL